MTILFIIVLAQPVMGMTTPNITFIPEQFSAGSSFIAIADADPLESTRITWFVGGVDLGYGSFPKIGDKFVCYFSGTDQDSICGPTPFTESSTPYIMQVDSINQYNEKTNSTLTVDVGSIELDYDIAVLNNTVYMEVFSVGPIADSISYAVYHKDNFSLVGSGYISLEKNLQTKRFEGNIELAGGDYYFAFITNSNTEFGGDLMKISIAKSEVEQGCTGSQQTGEYPLEIGEMEPLNAIINPNQNYEYSGYKVTNAGEEDMTGLTASIPFDFSKMLDIEFDSETLEVNSSMFFTVKLFNIQSATSINTIVDVVSDTGTVGKIPLEIFVSVIGGSSSSGGDFSIQPSTWSGSFLVGDDASKSFTITNSGAGEISLDYSVTGNIEDIATVTVPSTLTTSGSVDVYLDPVSSGNYQGSIIINSGSGSQTILVNTEFYDDLTYQIDSIKTDFEDLKSILSSAQLMLLANTIDEIDSAITSAESQIGYGNYKLAETSFIEAQAKVSALSDLATYQAPTNTPTTTCGPDLTLPLLFVIIIMAGGGAFLFMKNKKAGKENMDEELDKELEESFKAY